MINAAKALKPTASGEDKMIPSMADFVDRLKGIKSGQADQAS